MPPIPSDEEEFVWRRRATRRASYTSHMSCRVVPDTYRPSGLDQEKSVSRRPSGASSYNSRGAPEPKNPNAMEEELEGLHWDINPLNPRNWPRRKQWLHTLTAGAVTWTITFASSIAALAEPEFRDHFGITRTVATLPYAIFLLGLAFGPLISRPCSEVFGRKVIYMIFFPLFAIFTLATGLVHTSYGLIICRALAGLFAGPALSVGCNLMTDIWEATTLPFAVYYATPVLGPACGMVVGGYVTSALNGRWTQYVVLFAFAACLIPFVFLSETHKPIILRRKRNESARAPLERRAFSILAAQPAALALDFYSGFNFAVLYASCVAFPRVWSASYVYNLGSQGLMFVSMAIGVLAGVLILALHHFVLYRPRVARWQEKKAEEVEEARAAKRRASHRSSQQSAVSNFSRPNPRCTNTNIESATRSLSAFVSNSNASRPSTEYQRNVSLAVAAATYLNMLPANQGKRILPDRVQLILNDNPAFSDFCECLEALGLRMQRVQFARVLVDALPVDSNLGSVVSSSGEGSSPLERSQSLHRSAAAAAFDAPATMSSPPTRNSSHVQRPVVGTTIKPPARWRLWPALPASTLLAGSLFMFGWSAQERILWVAPAFGMGVFAFSLFIVFVCSQLYMVDALGPHETASAQAGDVIVRYAMGFAFAMFVEQMYDGLSIAWATSVFGFVAAALGVTPWILAFTGKSEPQVA